MIKQLRSLTRRSLHKKEKPYSNKERKFFKTQKWSQKVISLKKRFKYMVTPEFSIKFKIYFENIFCGFVEICGLFWTKKY